MLMSLLLHFMSRLVLFCLALYCIVFCCFNSFICHFVLTFLVSLYKHPSCLSLNSHLSSPPLFSSILSHLSSSLLVSSLTSFLSSSLLSYPLSHLSSSLLLYFLTSLLLSSLLLSHISPPLSSSLTSLLSSPVLSIFSFSPSLCLSIYQCIGSPFFSTSLGGQVSNAIARTYNCPCPNICILLLV